MTEMTALTAEFRSPAIDEIVREELGIASEMTILCSLAVDYLDPDFPGHSLRVTRERVDQHVVFLDE